MARGAKHPLMANVPAFCIDREKEEGTVGCNSVWGRIAASVASDNQKWARSHLMEYKRAELVCVELCIRLQPLLLTYAQ